MGWGFFSNHGAVILVAIHAAVQQNRKQKNQFVHPFFWSSIKYLGHCYFYEQTSVNLGKKTGGGRAHFCPPFICYCLFPPFAPFTPGECPNLRLKWNESPGSPASAFEKKFLLLFPPDSTMCNYYAYRYPNFELRGNKNKISVVRCEKSYQTQKTYARRSPIKISAVIACSFSWELQSSPHFSSPRIL